MTSKNIIADKAHCDIKSRKTVATQTNFRYELLKLDGLGNSEPPKNLCCFVLSVTFMDIIVIILVVHMNALGYAWVVH